MKNLDEILEGRKKKAQWYRSGSLVTSVLLHLVAAVAVLLAPKLLAQKPELPTFVSVQIVPASALGQVTPPAPAVPDPPTPQPMEPDPGKNEGETEPESRPVMPSQSSVGKEKREDDRLAPQAEPVQPVAVRTVTPEKRRGSPQGSPLATGGPAEISGFDDPSFTFSYYSELMLSRIRSQWERPPIGGEIDMVLRFRIRSDGRVSDLKILKSSGYSSFDRAGLRAVQQATLPPLPKSYRRRALGVRLIIR